MGRGVAFTSSEDDFLATMSEEKTAKELFEAHQEVRKEMVWPERSLKSLARRVERLREIGMVSIRSEETRRKAYYGRNRAIRGE